MFVSLFASLIAVGQLGIREWGGYFMSALTQVLYFCPLKINLLAL